MNPQIQAALTRLSALKDALGAAAGKAGNFIADEAKGTVANMADGFLHGGDNIAAARNAAADAAAQRTGFPSAAANVAALPGVPTTDMLTQFLTRAYGLAKRIKKKL